MSDTDTIAAIATPPGEGGIGVIRLSGPDCLNAVEQISSTKIHELTPRKATLLELHHPDTSEPLDEGLATYFPSPRSYTGEQVVELSCHGSPLLLQTLLNDLIRQENVRMAEPGEFTRRAFENDKMDLAQADAVASLISARSEAALRASARQLKGELSETVSDLRETLVYCQSRVEAGLDFGDEEDVGDIPYEEIKNQVMDTAERIETLVEHGEHGTLLEQGCRATIIGRPNVGKSSLLNKLLRESRAIVTETPGTTRDVISDQIVINGIPFKLHDTAGIRPNPESIEAEGIKRSKQALSRSDLVLFLIDQTEPIREADREIFQLIDDRPHLLVINKIDLEAEISKDDIEKDLEAEVDGKISAKTGEGLDTLRNLMANAIEQGDVTVENPLVTQTRHLDILRKTRRQLKRAIEGIESGRDPTLIAEDLRDASDHAGKITGDITTDDLLDEIFSSFCIGK